VAITVTSVPADDVGLPPRYEVGFLGHLTSCVVERFVLKHAGRSSHPYTRFAEDRSVVHRGSNDRQTQRDICSLVKYRELRWEVSLFAMHGHHRVALSHFLRKNAVPEEDGPSASIPSHCAA